MLGSAAAAALLALTALRVDAAFGPQSPLARVPPSYAQLCTTVNQDGSFSADSSACPSNLACTADASRDGAFYCGINGSPCQSGANCYTYGVDAACSNGVCTGGYGQIPFRYGGGYIGCLQSLSALDPRSPCGGNGIHCSSDARCQSGSCVPGTYGNVCAARSVDVGTTCDPTVSYSCSATSTGGVQLYCRSSDSTCQPTVGLGETCDSTSACEIPLYCSSSTAPAGNRNKCLAQTYVAGQSCAADPQYACSASASLFCSGTLNGDVCLPVGTTVGAVCYNDLSGNSCTAPLYCGGTAAADGYKNTCLSKAALGDSCAFDPVNGCVAGSYCTSTDQTCHALSTAVGQTCGTDLNACSAAAGLYCRTLDATCQVRLTSIGADCTADPVLGCGTATASDGTAIPLYCSMPSFRCAAKLGATASCSSNPSQACLDPLYCSSNTVTCVPRTITNTGSCNADPYAQCGVDQKAIRPGYNGQLYPSVYRNIDGNQICVCYQLAAPSSQVPPQGAFGLTTTGADCSADPTFSCGYSSTGVKLYCALSTSTCQAHVTTAGGSCAYDYLGACGITTDGSYTQLYPSIPEGSSGHADCTCVTKSDVIVRPSSRARARARERRNLSLCPGSHTACPVGSGFECINIENNLEQCGGCTDRGGVDCTSLPGVSAVGCVGGRCEIWACEESYAFDAATEGCARSYE